MQFTTITARDLIADDTVRTAPDSGLYGVHGVITALGRFGDRLLIVWEAGTTSLVRLNDFVLVGLKGKGS